MSDIQPTKPPSSSSDPSSPTTPDTTTPASEQSTPPSNSTDDKAETSKKDDAADKIIAAFAASPYVQANPSLETEVTDPANKDQIMQGVQYSLSIHKQGKQSLDKTNQETEDAIQAYAPPPTDENQPSSSSKKKGA
jgi:hypothetical protein